MDKISTDELRKVIALSDLPDEQLQWITDHSDYREYEDGMILINKGDPIDVMWIIIEGKVSFYMDVNGSQVHYYDFVNDATSGGIGGLIPYSRMKVSPGITYSVGKVRRLEMNKKYFHELELMNPVLIQRLIGYMTERARSFATLQLQHEKVSALGRLAAGIAHELNNPASAIDRMSSELVKRLKMNYELTEKLLQHKISPQLVLGIRAMVELKDSENALKKRLSPLQRMEREDEINDWLEGKGLPRNGETFAESGFTSKDLDVITCEFEKEEFIHVLTWLENLLISQKVLKDLSEASAKISSLVGAIKSHVHMDRTNDLLPTNINSDIENTLTLLGYKLRDKNIYVKKVFRENIPEVLARVGELNQVWTNIIDNAIFAVDKNGELVIETADDGKNVIVKIIDNGSGIPKEIQSRIFDPFFTTKKVGEGTGIGLDLASRIVKQHDGEISVNSEPGRTEFLIRLPVKETKKNIE